MLISEFGGFIKLINQLLSSSIFPILHYLYVLVMIKRLYFVKTEDHYMFEPENPAKSHYVRHRLSKYTDAKNIPEELQGTCFPKDIKNHREVRISTCDKLLLYLHINYSFL